MTKKRRATSRRPSTWNSLSDLTKASVEVTKAGVVLGVGMNVMGQLSRR